MVFIHLFIYLFYLFISLYGMFSMWFWVVLSCSVFVAKNLKT